MKVLHWRLLAGLWGVVCTIGRSAPVDTLSTVVVTAEIERDNLSSTSPFQQLSSEGLQRQGVSRTSDALKRFAGVNVRDYGGAGGLLTVNIRGLGAAHTTVMSDGLPVTSGRGGEVDLQRYDISEIGRLTIYSIDAPELLCPVAALGAAVLQLEREKDKKQKNGLYGHLAFSQSSFSSYETTGGISGILKGGTQIRTDLMYLTARNDYPFFVENGSASTTLRRTNSGLHKTTASTNVTQPLKNGELTTDITFYHNYRRLPGPVIYYVNENNEHLTEEDGRLSLRYRQSFGQVKIFAIGHYDGAKSLYTDVRPAYPGGVLRQNYHSKEGYFSGGVSVRLSKLSVAYATDITTSGLKSNLSNAQNVKRTDLAQALSIRLRLGKVEITGRGLLSYYNDHTKDSISSGKHLRLTPSLTAGWRVISTSRYSLRVRGGYKESFRKPSFNEAYYYHLGSQKLRPELASQFSFGLTFQSVLNNGMKTAITADGYINRVRDRIVSIPYNLFVWETINLGRVDIRGLDLTLALSAPLTSRHKLYLAGSYTLQDVADHSIKGSLSYGKQIAYTPRHTASGSITWENPWVNAVVHTTYASERYATIEHLPQTRLAAYNEWGFSLYRALTVNRHQLRLNVDLLNVFNRRYEIIRRYPMPGRAYQLKVSWNF